jgi:polar amino acid transport system substrate-binding protein
MSKIATSSMMIRHFRISILSIGILVLAVTPSRALSKPAPEHRSLIIATHHAPPFAVKTENGWDGIAIELVRRIAEERSFRVELREMGLAEMLDAVANGKVHAAAAAITITAGREQMLDFTHPFFTSGLGIAVPQRSELTWVSALKRIASGPFIQSLVALLAVLTLWGVLMWLSEQRSNGQFSRKPLRGIGSGIWWSAVTMTTVGYGDKAPVTLAGRIIGLIWMFTSIIVISGFTAAIASSLTVDELQQTVVGLEDLYRKRVVTVSASTSAGFLDRNLVRYRSIPTAAKALNELAKGHADAVVYDAPILQYLVAESHSADLQVLPNRLARQDYGIALPPESPFREELNRQILSIITEAEWTLMLEGYLGQEG